jgi:hypothetical protein
MTTIVVVRRQRVKSEELANLHYKIYDAIDKVLRKPKSLLQVSTCLEFIQYE